MRIAVLGCGRIGRLHAELLAHRIPGVTLAGVYDVVPTLAHSLAGQLGVASFESVDDVLAGPVDAVAICTSTDTHVALIGAAARAGLAIFCEKPIALDLTDVDKVLAEVESAGVPMHVGFNRRFDPAHQAVRQAVASGQLGRLRSVRITSRDPEPPPLAYLERSGGLFLDMTIHDLDLARYVTGSEVIDVFATGAVMIDPAIGDVGDVDTAVVVLRHDDGCATVIDNSRQCAYGYDQRVEAFGSDGAAASENPPAHTSVRWDGDGGHHPPIRTFFLDRYLASYVNQWLAFTAAVRDGAPPPVTAADGRMALILALAARQSVAEGRPVTPEVAVVSSA